MNKFSLDGIVSFAYDQVLLFTNILENDDPLFVHFSPIKNSVFHSNMYVIDDLYASKLWVLVKKSRLDLRKIFTADNSIP